MKFLRPLPLTILLLLVLAGAQAAVTALQWGVDRTTTPWTTCIYDSNNVCQGAFTIPATGGGVLLPASRGGTGVNNGTSTMTIGGNVSTAGAFTLSGAFGFTGTLTGTTSVTFPTTGLLANTAFVGTPTVDVFFSTGRPWCDVRAKGAVGDGVTDDYAAFNACRQVVEAFGTSGTIYVPTSTNAANYCVKSTLTLAAGGTQIVGENRNVALSSCGSGNTILKMNGSQEYAHDLTLTGPGADNETTFSATQSTLILGTACTDCTITRLTVLGGLHAIQWNAGEATAYDVTAYGSYGSGIMYFSAPNGNVAGGHLWHIKPDETNYPLSTPAAGTTFGTWAATTAYTAGNVVAITCQDTIQYYFQAMTSGTSGGSAPTCKNRGVTFADGAGSLTWQMAFPVGYAHWNCNSNCSQVTVNDSDTGGGSNGISLNNTDVVGGANPFQFTCINCNGGGSYVANFRGSKGNTVYLADYYTNACILPGCANITFDTTFSGMAEIEGGSSNTAPYAVMIAGGSGYTVHGLKDMTGLTSAGVYVTGAASHVAIADNTMPTAGKPAVQIDTTADYVQIAGNDFLNTAGLSNTSSGTHIAHTNNFATDPAAISATAPLTLSAAGAVSVTGAAGQVLAGAGPTFTASPVLGVAGSTVGSVGFQNATSGTITLQPVTGALGTVTLSLPAAADQLVARATTDTLTNKTLDTAGAGNVLKINGTQVSAVTGTGAVVLATSPTLVTPALGTPASGVLTNATGLPISTGVSGLGTGVATALGNATNSAGGVTTSPVPVANGGTGGTAASGTLLDNITGFASTGLLNRTGAGAYSFVGLGTGVATALGVNTNASGGFPTVPVANAQLANAATTVAGQTCTLGSTCGLSSIRFSLGSDVTMTNANTVYDGPSIAQGTTGTWFASGVVTVQATAGDQIACELWDGTALIASSTTGIPGGLIEGISLSGWLASPTGNIRISCRDNTSAGALIKATSTFGNASTVSAVRIN